LYFDSSIVSFSSVTISNKKNEINGKKNKNRGVKKERNNKFSILSSKKYNPERYNNPEKVMK
jgi:hypothetical protein